MVRFVARPAVTAIMAGIAVVLAGALTPAEAQTICKSTDSRGNVSYVDCRFVTLPSSSSGSADRSEPTHRPETSQRPTPASTATSPIAVRATPAGSSVPAAPAPAPRETVTSAAPLAQGPLGALRQISEQRLYMIAGGALLALGVVVALVAAVQYLIAAFNVGFWWGLGCVFLAPVSLVFLVLHWKVAKRPFLVSCLGTVIAGVGGVLLVGM